MATNKEKPFYIEGAWSGGRSNLTIGLYSKKIVIRISGFFKQYYTIIQYDQINEIAISKASLIGSNLIITTNSQEIQTIHFDTFESAKEFKDLILNKIKDNKSKNQNIILKTNSKPADISIGPLAITHFQLIVGLFLGILFVGLISELFVLIFNLK